MTGVPATPRPTCSAKGCREQAAWVLGWNNPKVHTPDRRKMWAACAAHRDQLADFLDVRGFLRDVVGVDEPESGRSTLAS
jgi:hypothetical protein